MAKLVIQNQGMTGRAHELNADHTTIGRVEDNIFQIADASVSSHHCEVHLRGGEILIRDLNSTNGSFINGEKITEKVLKPGQTLRLGQVELKLEVEGVAATAPSAPAIPVAPAKKSRWTRTMVMPRGVSLERVGKGRTPAGFRRHHGFHQEKQQGQQILHHRRHYRGHRDCGAALLRAPAGQLTTNKSGCGHETALFKSKLNLLRLETFLHGPVVNAEMLVVMLEKHGIAATQSFVDSTLPDDGDLSRPAQVFVPESDYDRALQIILHRTRGQL